MEEIDSRRDYPDELQEVLYGYESFDSETLDEPAITSELAEPPQDVQPLFDLIDHQGSAELGEADKIERIADVGSMLVSFGVNEQLAAEVGQAAEILGPLSALTLNRRPEDHERETMEGRGAYHQNIPVGGTTVTVYVKGTGNEAAFDQEPGIFNGFPTDHKRLFFDETTGPHPRIVGTETIRWGLTEAVRAGAIFAHVAQKEGWTHLQQALDAGVTIPLNVLAQKELSNYMAGLVNEAGANASKLDGGIAWEGNRHLGAVEMIVPSSVRVAPTGKTAVNPEVMERMLDPRIAAATGRTLRTLLGAGFCYSRSGAHAQNIYTEGLVTQADNSDLLTLGDCVDTPESSAYDKQVSLIFSQLDRQSTRPLTGLDAPIVTTNTHVTWEQVTEAGQAFWGNLLDGFAEPEHISRIVRLLPFIRTEANLAVAELLVQSQNEQEWQASAERQRTVMAAYEPRYGVLTEQQARLESFLDGSDLPPSQLHDLAAGKKLRSQAILDYLDTGHEHYLQQDPMLSKVVRLADAIESIPDKERRDALLGHCSRIFADKDVRTLAERPDIVTAFEGRQYDLLQTLISQNKLDDAEMAMDTLSIVHNTIGQHWVFHGDSEIHEHNFTRRLLEEGADYKALLQEAVFFSELNELSHHAASGGRDLLQVMRFVMDNVSPKESFEVSRTAHAANLPPLIDLLSAVLSSPQVGVEDRAAITEWMQRYNQQVAVTDIINDPDILLQHITEMDSMLTGIVDAYPELRLAHNSYAAGRLASTHPERAREYYDQGMDYYTSLIEERARHIGLPIEQWRWPSVYNVELAEKYRRMGLPLVAAAYDPAFARGPYW